MSTDVLDRFSPATAAWFRGSFSAPTPAQAGAWEAVSSGRHALVVAPTGSGKTLSAFLWALDRLASTPVPEEPKSRCRVLYVSPLKALAVDVERNLRSPLVGIGHAAERLGEPMSPVQVGVRSGDTPAAERRLFQRTPPDILITTPESLFLLLTSSARESLLGVETVILDEVHAVAGTKRGAHLALSLERLDALLPKPAQRIGLSATVRPVEEVARFLAGGRPVDVVQPTSTKEWDLQVVVPLADMSALGEVVEEDLSGPAAGAQRRASIWPHVEERIVDLVSQHRSTLVFANSRRLAERLTSRLNEIWDDRLTAAAEAAADPGDGADPPEAVAPTRPASRATPAQVMAQAGLSTGAPPLLARAHHGSVSKEQRAEIENALKAGQLPAVVATSSLELGIDMGAVDLVIQVESPPSVASGLQRVGRAGHQVGAVSRGVVFPKFRGDLVQTAVVVERMREGAIESLSVPANPLDVLAQQVVAMCALDDWPVDDLVRLVQGAAPYATLPRSALEAVLDMLSGRYPSDEFAELRPRLVWDRVTGVLSGRRGAQRLAVTSGGTIPDRGLYGVFLAGAEGTGRRVGELDEEMVYESRVGDVFTLGTSSWRIEDITHDRVLVSPAPGLPGKLPFWKGDSLGRPTELGAAVGRFVREVGGMAPERARERVAASGLDEWATDNLLAYLHEQKEATRHLPSDKTIVVERFRDELGDWRIAVHSPYGAPVHAPWALCVSARMRERFGVDVQAIHGDDGIVFRLPDLEFDELTSEGGGGTVGSELMSLIMLEPDEVHDLVTEQIGGSALFASRFRECASRALLLPRRRPGQRQALWQQRQRSAQLLEVASQYPSFPIVLEAVRECVQDVFDVPGLVDLMRRIGSREVATVDVETSVPSPFARSLTFGYVAQFIYEGDSPLAERRAAALSLDPTLLAELLGRGDGLSLRDLLDPEAVARTEAELQRLDENRRCRDAEDVVDLLRALGPLPHEDVVARTAEGTTTRDVGAWLVDLEGSRQVIRVRVAGEERWAAVEDASRLRDALGASLPTGVPDVFLEPVTDPLGDLVSRYARTHGPFAAADLARWLGLGPAVVTDALRRLVGSGRLVEGALRPDPTGAGGGGTDFCDAGVLRTIRRRSLAALRAEVEPVTGRDLARFLPAWQGVGGQLRGLEGLVRAVEQLGGAVLPASALETLVLPGRVAGYTPGMLDELMSSGDVLWRGHGSLPGDDGWVSLHVTDLAPLTLPPPDESAELGDLPLAVLDALASGGAYFFRSLADVVGSTDDEALTQALWDLVWAGRLTNDTLAPLRALLGGGRTAHKKRAVGPRRGRYTPRPGALGMRSGLARPSLPVRTGPPSAAGRWSLLPGSVADPTQVAYATAEVLLDRYGVVTRGSVMAEEVPGGFAGVYRVLAAAEESGRVRRGYFVEGLGAAQFGTTGAVDRLRAQSRPVEDERAREDAPAVVLAACDPANPYGAALPWPDRDHPAPDGTPTAASAADGAEPTPTGRKAPRGHQPGRKAGALVVLVDGDLVLYVERGGRTLLTWTDEPSALQRGADALALAVREGALGRLTVEKTDGEQVLGSGHPLADALSRAGFHATPRGLRLRR
ncbi:ATP-dependent helicase [Lapillicoccus jejuensis]|uniref:Lhr family ATP dependent helicase n=1 Tax=Lapillicoccus jejuensis TaxID=402171 RepID=A0A542E6C3_9MICO|nr:ATP-dependent helicase [Lapillicoccus jejuensis]TQJ10885.1 Lhr family ATP dependent helicase [Lapillicoccus jejuensis]